MSDRTTVILGAGAILDLKFGDGLMKPTTANITEAVMDIEAEDADGNSYKIIKILTDAVEEKLHKLQHGKEYKLNFEDIFHILESCLTNSFAWHSDILDPSIYPLMAALCDPATDYAFKDEILYWRAMAKMIVRILNIIHEYDSVFGTGRLDEQWYIDFWKSNSNNWDIFNFNYDTTIEQSLGKYQDGSINQGESFKHFNPKKMMDNSRRLSKVNHPHGCISYMIDRDYSFPFEYKQYDLFKTTNFEEVIESVNSQIISVKNQANDNYFPSPIISGKHKTDKITYQPMATYHANLQKCLMKNHKLLIIGYSFGDLYVNQLLDNMRLYHGEKFKVTIIDKLQPKLFYNPVMGYQDFRCPDMPGAMNTFMRRMLGKESYRSLRQLDESYYATADNSFELYINGFKDAVTAMTMQP